MVILSADHYCLRYGRLNHKCKFHITNWHKTIYVLHFVDVALRLLTPQHALSANKLSRSANCENINCIFLNIVYLFDTIKIIEISAPLHEISGLIWKR